MYPEDWGTMAYVEGQLVLLRGLPMRPGASRKTLERRVRYNSRKGRSAARRLRAWPESGTYRVGAVSAGLAPLTTMVAPLAAQVEP